MTDQNLGLEVRHDDAWRELLSAYADGECDATERTQAEAHLSQCEDCRHWLEQTRADQALFSEALVSATGDSELPARVMAEVGGMPAPEKPGAQPQGGRAFRLRLSLVEILVVVLIMSILAAILFPVFARAREKARQTSCQSNLRQIGLGMLMFAADHGDRLPDAPRWTEQVLPYIKNEQLLQCPMDRSRAKVSYAMNPRYSGANPKDFEHPEELIVAFDADETGRPVARHNDGLDCLFMDGHVKWLPGIPDQLTGTTGLIPPSRGYGLTDKLKLAYTASAELWVKSVYQATLAAEATFVQRGGFVLSSTLQAAARPYTAQVVGRVPTAEVANTLNALAQLGWVARRDITGEDLTPKYLDEQRAVQSAETREQRLTSVVREATRQKHVVQTEENLAKTEGTHDQARGELYRIADRTTLASITATITQTQPEPPPGPPLQNSLRRAVHALKAAGLALAQVGIWLGLFAWAWVPAAWLGWRWQRRRHA